MVNFFVNKLNRLIFHKISPDERLLDPLSYQEARPWGNLRPGFSFPSPDRQRHSLPSLPGLGPRWFMRKPSKKVAIVAGAVGIGLAAFEFFAAKHGLASHGVARPGIAR